MLRDLWALSLAVRFVSVAIGLSRASTAWFIWGILYLGTGILLRLADIIRPGPHVYVDLWCFQQIGSVALLAWVVFRLVKPTESLVRIASVVALVCAGIIAQSNHWPGSPTETVMWGCGAVSLALGIIASAGTVTKPTADSSILSGFLILYSLLMLAGSDYLNSVNLGIAWSILEITAFGAWGVSHLNGEYPA